jgi:hypothetical protein
MLLIEFSGYIESPPLSSCILEIIDYQKLEELKELLKFQIQIVRNDSNNIKCPFFDFQLIFKK